MKKKIGYLSAFLLVFLFSCSNPSDTPSGIFRINPDEFIDVPENGTDWIETIKFLPLKSDGKHFIPSDANIKFRDDFILFGNFDKLLIFNSKGEFIHELDSKGKGPEEYAYIGDYDLIPGTEEVVIIGNKKLHFYTIDGKFIETKNIPFTCMSIGALSNDKFISVLGRERQGWAYDQSINYQLVILNRKGEIVDKRFEFPYSSLNFPSHNEILQSSDQKSRLFHFYFDYNLYSIDPSGDIQIKYTVDYGQLVSDTAFLQQQSLETMPSISPHINGRTGFSNSIGETSNTLGIQVGSDKREKMTFQMINRKSGNQFTLVMEDDAIISRFHGWPLHPFWAATTDYFFQPVQAMDVIEILESLSSEQKKKLTKYEGFTELSNVQENDELVFVLYKVKDF